MGDIPILTARALEIAAQAPQGKPGAAGIVVEKGFFLNGRNHYRGYPSIDQGVEGASPIQPGLEYQRNVFYSRDFGIKEMGNAESLNNAAQYYGTEYVFLDSHQDCVDLYKAAGWELVHNDDGVELWYYPDSIKLVNFSSKPAILVTEKPGREIYLTIFRLANDGLLPYQEAYMVEGEERIDFYTLDDLKPFNAILPI